MPLLFVPPHHFVDSPVYTHQPVHPSHFSRPSRASRESNYWHNVAERLERQASVARENEAQAQIRAIQEQQQAAQAYYDSQCFGGPCGVRSFPSPFEPRHRPHSCDCHHPHEDIPSVSYEQELRNERNVRAARAAQEARHRHAEKHRQRERHHQGLHTFDEILRALTESDETGEVQVPRRNRDVKAGKQRVPVDAPAFHPTPVASSSTTEGAPVEVDQSRSLNALDHIEKNFVSLKSDFVFPDHVDFSVDSDSTESLDGVPALLYTPVNNALHAYEHQLNSLMGKLDEVESGGLGVIRERRKSLVRRVEQELQELDARKVAAWEASKNTSTVTLEAVGSGAEVVPEEVMTEAEPEEQVVPEDAPMDVEDTEESDSTATIVPTKEVNVNSSVVNDLLADVPVDASPITVVPPQSESEPHLAQDANAVPSPIEVEVEVETAPISIPISDGASAHLPQDANAVPSPIEVEVETAPIPIPISDGPSVVSTTPPEEPILEEPETPTVAADVDVNFEDVKPLSDAVEPVLSPTVHSEGSEELEEDGLEGYALVKSEADIKSEENDDVQVESELAVELENEEKDSNIQHAPLPESDAEDFEMV